MKQISSHENRIIREAASLSEKKYREKLGAFLVEGVKLVREAVLQGSDVLSVLVRTGAGEAALSLARDAENSGLVVYELSSEAFVRVVKTETPQDIAAVLALPGLDEGAFFEKTGAGNILVLDRLQDPGNVGTLIRTAEAMGFKGILGIKGTADPFQPKVVRAAAGSILRMPVLICERGEAACCVLERNGRRIFAAAAGEGSADCSETDIADGAAIVIGNEGSGISEEIKTRAQLIRIPMQGNTESLNAAIAGSLIMYESMRQKGFNSKK